MMKYQLKLVTMYMAHRARTFRLVKIFAHGTPAWASSVVRPASIRSRSAWLVAGCSCGWLRNQK